jgi:trimeric autotransporter adhesin
MYVSCTSLRSCLSPIFATCLVSFVGVADQAQEPSAPAAAVELSQSQAIPSMVRFQGTLPDIAGQQVILRLSIYATEEATSPLWQESQLVKTDARGNYTVLLGAGSAIGLPDGLFSAGEPRWLGVKAGDREESRSLLTSVPYAMKAADADSLGGQPAASFVTQSQLAAKMRATASALAAKALSPMPAASPTGSGTAGYLPVWTSGTALGDSSLFQSGSGTTAKVGIGTKAPATMLDVQGATTLQGNVTLASAAATATAGANSPSLRWAASSYDSKTKAAVGQNFVWQAQPDGNNSTSPTAKLALLFAAGTATPAPTGLSIAPDGVITFASKQTFPGSGAGGGTITGVTAGNGLTGGGTSGKVMLAVDATKVALLGAANTFSQETAFNAETSITANSTDWALVVTNTSATAKGTLLGQAQGSNLGIEGASPGGSGVLGATNTGNGVEGSATTGLGGYFHNTSTSDAALAGEANSTAGTAVGVFGSAANGSAVYGTASNLGNGVYGASRPMGMA